MTQPDKTLRFLLSQIGESESINHHAVAFIMTEREFRGPFFRWAELLYASISILVLQSEPRITLGHCQVSFGYWRAHYGRNTLLLLLGTMSLKESYKICCLYLHKNGRGSLRESLVAYNGRPSKLYVDRFFKNLNLVNMALRCPRGAGMASEHFLCVN